MLNCIWTGIILVSILYASLTGRIDQLSSAITQGADKAIQLLISIAGVMCLWSGIMNIAQQSGAAAKLANLLSPILHKLMPDIPPDSDAMAAVSANITANLLGLGNAATPLGIKAMQEIKKAGRLTDTPNRSMIIFVLINTASIQLIPTTAAALRQAAGSQSAYDILPYVWLVSALSLGIALLLAAGCYPLWRKQHG